MILSDRIDITITLFPLLDADVNGVNVLFAPLNRHLVFKLNEWTKLIFILLKMNEWLLVTVVALVVLIIVIIALVLGHNKKQRSLYSQPACQVQATNQQVAPVIKAEEPKIMVESAAAPSLPPAPVLRCYDYFEFPQEGGFHVKTCSAPQRDTQAIPKNNPKRIFLQWFPIEGAASYNIYANHGSTVGLDSYVKKWTVGGDRHYFESEELTDPVCWSATVTSVNKAGLESAVSTIYSTCQS